MDSTAYNCCRDCVYYDVNDMSKCPNPNFRCDWERNLGGVSKCPMPESRRCRPCPSYKLKTENNNADL